MLLAKNEFITQLESREKDNLEKIAELQGLLTKEIERDRQRDLIDVMELIEAKKLMERPIELDKKQEKQPVEQTGKRRKG